MELVSGWVGWMELVGGWDEVSGRRLIRNKKKMGFI